MLKCTLWSCFTTTDTTAYTASELLPRKTKPEDN